MKKFVLVACIVFVVLAGANAQEGVWQPSPGHEQMRIWPGAAPDATPSAVPESLKATEDEPVAGRPWFEVENVSQPTMTVYSPVTKNTGAAVIVFPGGGYKILAIDLEGTEVADWLTSKGITCVLLKYRVPNSGPYVDTDHKHYVYPNVPAALQDAQRTIGLVRFHASEWHINPHKVGVLGFSAGGHLAAGVSTNFERRTYAAVDAADQESCRPDFAVVIYPGHLWVGDDLDPSLADDKLDLRPDIRVTRQTSPTFLLQTEDDHVDGVEQSLVYYIALKKAGVPVEMHLYAQGGHAFGLRRTAFPVTRWPELVEAWLRTINVLSE